MANGESSVSARRVLLLWLVVVAAVAARGRSAVADTNVVKAKLKAGALVLDVRTPAEVAEAAYPGAINIPLAELAERLPELGDKKRPIVIFCRSGNRSAQAKALLEKSGFADVTNAGGLKDMPPR